MTTKPFDLARAMANGGRCQTRDGRPECAEDCAAEPEYDPGTPMSWAVIQDSRKRCAEDDAMLGAVAELIGVLALPPPADLVP